MDRYLSLFNTRLLALLLVVASLAIAVAAGGVARGEELEPNPPALIPVSAAVLDNTSTYKDSIVHHSRKRGDTISYRIYVFNSGTDAAHNVAVVDPLPPHTSYVPNSLTINFSNQSMATWPGTVFLGTIPYSTSSVRIEYSVLITGDAPVGVITNTATISGDGIDPFTRSDSTNVSAKADLDNWDTYKYLTTQRAYAPLESLEYNIRVRNSGNDTARNVRIVEKLPPNTTYLPNTLKIDNFVSPQGTGALPAAILLGDIAPSSEKNVKLQVRIGSGAPPGNLINTADILADNVARFSRVTSNTVTHLTVFGLMDNKSTYKTASTVRPLRRGDQITYTVFVNNSGGAAISGVTLEEILPRDTTYLKDSLRVDGVNQSVGSLAAPITLPDIAASTTARVDLDVSVNDDAAPGTITNTAIIRPPTLGPISRHVSHTITVNPDLENTNTYKYGSGSRVLKPGDLMTYYVYVYNDGTDTARDARVKEFLPPQVTYVPGSLRIQGVDQNEKELPDPILLGDIGRNVSRYMYFTVRVHDFAAPGPIVNRAVITAQGGLTVVRHATNDISARAVLNSTSTYKYASPQGTLKRGDCFYYYVYVKNSGTAWARGVEVRDFLPAKVTYVAGSLIVDGQDQHEKTLPSVIKFPDIGPGSTKYMYFRVCVNSDAAQGLLRNTARISAFGVEPMVRTFTHTVSVKADLDNLNTYKYPVDVVSRTDTNTLRSGDIVEYRIWLYNNGSDTATGINITEKLAPGSSYVPNSLQFNDVNQFKATLPVPIQVGSLGPNLSRYVDFKVRVGAGASAGTMTDTAIIAADNILRSFTRTYSHSVTLQGSRLDNYFSHKYNNSLTRVSVPGVAKLDDPDSHTSAATLRKPVRRRDRVGYVINIHNNGSTAATGVQVQDTISPHTTYDAGTLRINGVNPFDTTLPATINVGTINAGSTKNVTFSVTVKNTAPEGMIVNTADISGAGIPSFTRVISHHLTANPDLNNIDTDKLVNPSSGAVRPGQEVIYDIYVKNDGTAAATNVRVQDLIDPKTDYKPGSLLIDNIDQIAQNLPVPIQLGTVNRGQRIRIIFKVIVSGDAPAGLIVNRAIVRADGLPAFTLFASHDVAGTQLVVSRVSKPPTRCLGRAATHIGTPGGEIIDGSPGPDVILGLGGDDIILGRDGDDRICAGAGDDTVWGGDGNDNILGQLGDDMIAGGSGNDILSGQAGNDLIRGALGNDKLFGGGQDDTMYGGLGADELFGGFGSDTMAGGGGNDKMFGGGQDDTMYGGTGADQMFGGPGSDVMNGGPGNDTVDGSGGDDQVYGGGGKDDLFGRLGNDLLGGGPGDFDTLRGGLGFDLCNGGPGTGDRAFACERTGGIP